MNASVVIDSTFIILVDMVKFFCVCCEGVLVNGNVASF